MQTVATLDPTTLVFGDKKPSSKHIGSHAVPLLLDNKPAHVQLKRQRHAGGALPFEEGNVHALIGDHAACEPPDGALLPRQQGDPQPVAGAVRALVAEVCAIADTEAVARPDPAKRELARQLELV